MGANDLLNNHEAFDDHGTMTENCGLGLQRVGQIICQISHNYDGVHGINNLRLTER